MKKILAEREARLKKEAEDNAKARRHAGFRRTCCSEEKIVDHHRGWWKAKFKWERNEFVIDPEKRSKNMSNKEKVAEKKLKEMRENQFR